jgi:F0F1-type ATP synthase assembly protein I
MRQSNRKSLNQVGLIFGAVLGALDGATAWFTSDARSMMASIMVGSTIKGMVVGLLSGWFARKVNSTRWGIVVGSVLGLAFAFAVAAMPSENGQHYYLEIMLPGFVVGAIIGFLTQKMGTPAAGQRES